MDIDIPQIFVHMTSGCLGFVSLIVFFLNMYVYININLCKFRRLPSCGQAQGVVPFLRCWETYCAKQVCFPLLKNIQSAQSSKPLSTGHC